MNRVLVIDTQDRQQRAAKLISILPLVKPLKVTIEEYHEKRSDSQNKRLWALHTLASEVTGYTPEEMHELALCEHFGSAEKECKNPWTGDIEIKRVPLKRSSARDVKEFAKFMEATENLYVTKLGVFLGDE